MTFLLDFFIYCENRIFDIRIRSMNRENPFCNFWGLINIHNRKQINTQLILPHKILTKEIN